MAGRRLPGRKAIGVLIAIIAIGAAIWVLFVGKRPIAPPVPSPSASATSTSPRAATGALAAAVQAAFPDGTATIAADGQRFTFGNHRLVAAPFGTVLVSEGEASDAAHVTTGRLDVFYLTPTADGFTAANHYPAAVAAGSFGSMADWTVSGAFANNPVIDAKGGSTGQGFTCGYDVLTELTPTGPAELARVQTTYDDTGARDQGAQSLTGTIADVRRNRGFVVRYTGTATFEEQWMWRGGKYVAERATKVPTC